MTVAEGQARASGSRETLAQLRWKRIAIAAVWLSNILPESLSIDAADGGHVTAGTSQPLEVHTIPTSEQISNADQHGRSESDDSRSTLHGGSLSPPDEARRREVGTIGGSVSSAASVVPGYTCMLADASTLAGDLDAVMAILDCKKWVVVVPLSGESFDGQRQDAQCSDYPYPLLSRNGIGRSLQRPFYTAGLGP